MSKKKFPPRPAPEYVSTGSQWGTASWLQLRETMAAGLEPAPRDPLGGWKEALRLTERRSSTFTIVEVGPR